MHPEILRLGPFTVHAYGLMIAAGILVAFPVVVRAAHRVGLPLLDRHLLRIFVVVTLAAYLGGKLGFLLGDHEAARALLSRRGVQGLLVEGFVFHGALLLVIPSLFVLLGRLRLPRRRSLDVLILAAPWLHGLGRIGCLLAGCCFGCRTDSPFGVVLPAVPALEGRPVHPAPLYEAIGLLLLVPFLERQVRPGRPAGRAFALFLLVSGLLRFAVELVRGDQNPVWVGSRATLPGEPPGGLTQGQVLGLSLALLGALLLRWRGEPHGGSVPAGPGTPPGG
jgi:phosphatidylglycerol:prolipoprotein diacylglycerol transferase